MLARLNGKSFVIFPQWILQKLREWILQKLREPEFPRLGRDPSFWTKQCGGLEIEISARTEDLGCLRVTHTHGGGGGEAGGTKTERGNRERKGGREEGRKGKRNRETPSVADLTSLCVVFTLHFPHPHRTLKAPERLKSIFSERKPTPVI